MPSERSCPNPSSFRRTNRWQFARPWIAIGIGASHSDKDWSDATWCEFLSALRAPGTVFVVGGPANDARAEKFISACGSGHIVNACGLRLIETGRAVAACRSVHRPEFGAAQPRCRRRANLSPTALRRAVSTCKFGSVEGRGTFMAAIKGRSQSIG